MNQVVAIGDCFVCKRTFMFDADAVPSVWIDSATGVPPPDGHPPPDTAYRQPVCYSCAETVARLRLDEGVADLWHGRWGTPS